jgi:hypothetical protein
MSESSNPVECSICARFKIKTLNCSDSVCFFCHKEPSVDHPVITVWGEVWHERVFGIECLVHWQNTVSSRCKLMTATYGYTKDPCVDPNTTKYGGFLRDPNKPQRQPTPAGKKPSWLARHVEDVKYEWRRHKYERKMEIYVHPWKIYISGRWGKQRRIRLWCWDGVAPVVMIPDKWQKDPLFPREGFPPL